MQSPAPSPQDLGLWAEGPPGPPCAELLGQCGARGTGHPPSSWPICLVGGGQVGGWPAASADALSHLRFGDVALC